MYERLRRTIPLLLALGVGMWLVAVLCTVWLARLGHPFDLEWMEGGMLAHAWRVQRGLPLYVEPSADWIPYIYPPGYSALLALMGQFVELDYPLGRGVSLAGTWAAALAIVFTVGRATRGWLPGLLAGIAFLGCYQNVGAFFDLVRPDGLAMGLLGWSVALAFERSRGAVVLSALLLAAAFATKHHAAAFGLPLLVGISWRDGWRRGALFAGVAVPAGLVVLVAMHAFGSEVLRYLVEVPASHGVKGRRIVPGTPWELGLALGPAGALAGCWYLSKTIGRRGWALVAMVTVALVGVALSEVGSERTVGAVLAAPRDALGLGLTRVRGIQSPGALASALGMVTLLAGGLAVVVGLARSARNARTSERVSVARGHAVLGVAVVAMSVVMAGWMRGHHGGYVNVHIPMFWCVSLGFGWALARSLEKGSWWWNAGIGLIAVWQLGQPLMRLEPESLIGTEADVAAGAAVVSKLEGVSGPVLSPFAPWLPVKAGHPPSLHLIALWDVDYRHGPYAETREMLRSAMLERHWGAIVDGEKTFEKPSEADRRRRSCLSSGGCPGGRYGVADAYRVSETFRIGAALRGKSGWRARPGALLVPREE